MGQGQLRQLQYPVEIHGVELLEDVLRVEGKGSLAWLLRHANAVQLDHEWLG
jgi:hypothetical protein